MNGLGGGGVAGDDGPDLDALADSARRALPII